MPSYIRWWLKISVETEAQSKTQGSGDRKSTRLNSSHLVISYAVFCLKKKTTSSVERLAVGFEERLHSGHGLLGRAGRDLLVESAARTHRLRALCVRSRRFTIRSADP